MNIIRVKLPEKTIRLKPFTMKDYMDLLLIRKEVEEASADEAKQILDEMLEELYPDYDKEYRAYIFITVFAISVGKEILPLTYRCPKCKKNKKFPFKIALNKLEYPVLETAGIKIKFKFTEYVTNDIYELFEHCILSISDENNTYKWSELSDSTKEQVLSVITLEDFESIIKKIYPTYIEVNLSCCDEKTLVYTKFLDIFKLLVSDEELIMTYRINHIITQYKYPLSEIMKMTPMERTITLALIEADIKNKAKK